MPQQLLVGHILVWERVYAPWSGIPGRLRATPVVSLGRINCAYVHHCTWSYTIKQFQRPCGPIFGTKPTLWSTTKELELKVFVPKCLYCLLWCRLPTTHPFICLLCMAVDATPSQSIDMDIVPSLPPALTPAQLQDPYTTKLNLSNLRCNY